MDCPAAAVKAARSPEKQNALRKIRFVGASDMDPSLDHVRNWPRTLEMIKLPLSIPKQVGL